MPGRPVVLRTSARVAPGLLSAGAWDLLRSAAAVLAPAGHPQASPLRAAGVPVEELPVGADPSAPLGRLGARAALEPARPVVWLAPPDEAGPPGVEEVEASWDLPGARLLDLVRVMDRLRSPGGCPWDAQQTHRSLAPYLLEEAYETLEALDGDDDDHLREELGDLLLQVVFHARVAQERAQRPWSVDDVAGGIVDKLVRRHPHVFGGAEAATAAHVEARWEELKAAEKGRSSVLDGVPSAMPALARAAKLITRVRRAGLDVPLPATDAAGERLLRLVGDVVAGGDEPEQELREALGRWAAGVRAVEGDAS